ncbi:MAG: hypothetical protein FJ152_09115 [Firmicutes bacterium]|nr:hypothetical protein [Bacillota bacterium]
MKIRPFVLVFIIALSMILFSSAGLCNGGVTTQSAGLSQLSGTTGGELRRYIDISSPWSGGYLFEDMTVVGSASVTESFTMNNLGPGSEANYWEKAYDDFGIGFDPNPDIFPKAASQVSPPPASGSASKPAAAVAGTSVIVKAEGDADIRVGFRWLDLF